MIYANYENNTRPFFFHDMAFFHILLLKIVLSFFFSLSHYILRKYKNTFYSTNIREIRSIYAPIIFPSRWLPLAFPRLLFGNVIYKQSSRSTSFNFTFTHRRRTRIVRILSRRFNSCTTCRLSIALL